MDQRQIQRALDRRNVTITEVDPVNSHIQAKDNLGTQMMINVVNKPTFFQLPVAGEVWQVSRQGSEWFLESRIDSPDVNVPLSAMKPGDARIEAPGDIYIGSHGHTVQIEGDLAVTGTIFSGGIGDVAGGDLTGTYPNPSIASNAVTSAKIADGTIVNGDINSAAAIDYSKLSIPASSIEGSKMNRHIGSSPPGSPSDGDLWIYNGLSGIYWQFIYDSSETTYKWKFVGGPPFTASDTGDVSTAGNTWIGFSGVVATPRAGDYIVQFGDSIGNSIGASGPSLNIFWDVQLGNGSTLYDEAVFTRFVSTASGVQNTFFTRSRGPIRLNAIPASTTFQLFYTVTNWDLISYNRHISFYPARW
jgi:hypothetical protein